MPFPAWGLGPAEGPSPGLAVAAGRGSGTTETQDAKGSPGPDSVISTPKCIQQAVSHAAW